MESKPLFAVDTNAEPWEEVQHAPTGKVLYRKDLHVDPETGMLLRMVRYPAGFMNPLHTHNCAHAMYILEGTLVTREGRFGPGNLVWFPEGNVMEHGATAEEDVTVLFITNKPFDIHYLSEKSK